VLEQGKVKLIESTTALMERHQKANLEEVFLELMHEID
jgi:ABC-type Na+ transport system ATPase subunit NatA